MNQQKRGYYHFNTYYDIEKKEHIIWLWCLKIEDKIYYGKSIKEFMNIFHSLKYRITLWSFNFSDTDSKIIKSYLFSEDKKYKYIIPEIMAKKDIPLKKKVWEQISGKNGCIFIKFYNIYGYKITFFSTKKTVTWGNLISWANIFNIDIKLPPLLKMKKSILFEKKEDSEIGMENIPITKWIKNGQILPNEYIESIKNIIDISLLTIEYNLKIIDYKGANYKPTLATNAIWWWYNNSIIDLWSFYRNQIKSYEIWNDLFSSYRGGYFYYDDKKGRTKVFDKKSSYLETLITNKMPIGEPVKCYDKNCNHDLSIINYLYLDFKLKERKLPIIERNQEYVNNGKSIIWIAIKQEHDKIKENYDYQYRSLVWKYCFESRNMLFHQYGEKFYLIKEKNTGILREYAKAYCVTPWGFEAQSPIKNINIYELVKDYEPKENDIYFKSDNGFWLEKVINKFEDKNKYFDSKKCKYIPLPIFLASYQKLEVIEIGEANYDRLKKIETDSIEIIGDEKDFVWPKNKNNLPDWAIEYKLGKWRQIKNH